MTLAASTRSSRDVVFQAAVAVLRRDGASGLRVRAVASEAGCSTKGVYTHFGSKNGLVEAIFIDGFERLDRALTSAPTTGTWIDRLGARCLEYRRWALANPTNYMVMFGDAVPEFTPGPDAAARGRLTFMDLVERVGAAIAAGEFGPSDPTAAAYHLWATKHGYVMLELAHMNRTFPGDADLIYATGLTRLFDSLSRPSP